MSYNDAEASRLIIVLFSIITTASDIIILYLLHNVSLRIPKPNQYDHNNKKQNCLFGRLYPSFYFIDSSKLNNNNDENEERKSLIMNNNNFSYFGENETSIWSQLFRHRTISEYISLSLQFWSFCCGVIAFYLLSVFFMNMILEYIIICIADSWSVHLIGLLALFFLMENIFWFIRRQFESLFIICRNSMDLYHITIVNIWRFFNLFSCIIFSIWVAIDNDFIPFSDILFWQFFLFFMVIRGILFQILYGFVAFIQSIIMILYKIGCAATQKINICQLIFVMDTGSRDRLQCPKWVQFGYIIAVFFYIAIFIFLYLINNDELFRFAAGTGILYYAIMAFERGKYNALYILWITRYHQEYFERLVGAQEVNMINNKAQSVNSILSMDIAVAEEPKNESNKRKPHHKQNTHGTMLIKDDADLPLIKAVQYDIDALMMHRMKYTEFWTKIKYDYERNDYFGVNKYCHCAQDWLGWFCIMIFIIALIITAYLYMIQSNETTKEVFKTDDILSMPTYPICDFNLRGNNYLSVMDLTYLSIAAYYGSTQDINKQFNDWFGSNYNSSWDMNSLSLHQHPSFFHIHNQQFNFDVVAIRGTVDKSDTEQDIGLWTEVVTFQIFSWLIPLTELFPLGFIRQFIDLASIPEKMISPSVRDNYDNPVYDYIKDNIVSNNDSYIIVIGHSLGGAIAQIVAARLFNDGYSDNDNIISFGISSPGTLYSSKKFGFNVDSLDKTSVNLLPRRDIVTMIDNFGGIVQNIECNAKQVFSCHSAQTTFCEMHEQCSNQLTRNVTFANCVCMQQKPWSSCW